MEPIELKTPEGYFDDSFARTMSGVARIRKRRRAALGAVAAAAVVVFGVVYTSIRAERAAEEKEYLALQAELADYDIFIEIN